MHTLTSSNPTYGITLYQLYLLASFTLTPLLYLGDYSDGNASTYAIQSIVLNFSGLSSCTPWFSSIFVTVLGVKRLEFLVMRCFDKPSQMGSKPCNWWEYLLEQREGCMLLHCLPSRSSSRIGQMQHCDNKGVDSPLKGYRRRLGWSFLASLCGD